MKRFFLVAALSSTAFGQEPTVIGGTPADPLEFPASVYASTSNAWCSATVVGERSVLIAAHCAKTGQRIDFTAGPNKYSAICTRAAAYARNDTADWSLCLADKKITGIPFEVVNTDPSLVKVGDTLLLSGYGCTRSNGNGGNDGIYRTGNAKVTAVPSGTDNDIVTVGKVALCYGDSGGPAFLETSPGKRVQVGINSRGDISKTSYLSSTATQAAVQFLLSWAAQKEQYICGVHVQAEGCRD